MPATNPFPSQEEEDSLLKEMLSDLTTQTERDTASFSTSQSADTADDSIDYSSLEPSQSTQKPSISKARAKKARKAAQQEINQTSNPSLRPAKDIISRIRHDPSLIEDDFIIGYHDRHAPEVMEMTVSSWKGDVTDEEWVPQHRIAYFRKKVDESGRRMWDRGQRLDRFFGSGLPQTDQASSPEEGPDQSASESVNEILDDNDRNLPSKTVDRRQP